MTSPQNKDLGREPPRSPHQRVHDYVILARTLDKCRASLGGAAGEYHFDCPLDRILFRFKEISADDFLAEVKRGATDEEMGQWLDRSGAVQTPGSISQWSQKMDSYRPFDDPDKRDWFIAQCQPLGLNPRETTLFGWLDADDQASFPHYRPVARDSVNWDLPLIDTAPGHRKSSLKATQH